MDINNSNENKQDTVKEEIKKPIKKENKWVAEGQLSLFECM